MTTTIISKRSFSAVTLCASLALSGCDLAKDIPVGTGYAARNICSQYFLSGIDLKTATHRYVAPAVKPLPLLWAIEVDEVNRTVSVRDQIFINQNRNTAYYREGVGCTLLHDSTPEQLDAQLPLITPPQDATAAPWPLGDGPVDAGLPGIDYPALGAAVDAAFAETGPTPINTLAVAVVHQGQLIAEQYANGIGPDTRLIGWSMTKSFTATLIGLLYDQARLTLDAPAPVAEWQGTDKAAITLVDLLHMAAGLEWSETAQGDTPDQGRMLFVAPDFASYYAAKPVVAEPGTRFNYSTGVSSLLGRIAQDTIGGSLADTYHFMNDTLFHPLGIDDAVLEFDTLGQPAGGSGQILSSDWIDQALTPSPANPIYGYQIWLNTAGKIWPSLPEDSFAFRGFQQQIVLVIPRHDLIIVRLGVTVDDGATGTGPSGFNVEQLANDILAALPANDSGEPSP
jgi:hypothetical protein